MILNNLKELFNTLGSGLRRGTFKGTSGENAYCAIDYMYSNIWINRTAQNLFRSSAVWDVTNAVTYNTMSLCLSTNTNPVTADEYKSFPVGGNGIGSNIQYSVTTNNSSDIPVLQYHVDFIGTRSYTISSIEWCYFGYYVDTGKDAKILLDRVLLPNPVEVTYGKVISLTYTQKYDISFYLD